MFFTILHSVLVLYFGENIIKVMGLVITSLLIGLWMSERSELYLNNRSVEVFKNAFSVLVLNPCAFICSVICTMFIPTLFNDIANAGALIKLGLLTRLLLMAACPISLLVLCIAVSNKIDLLNNKAKRVLKYYCSQ